MLAALAALVAGIITVIMAVSLKQAASATDALSGVLGPNCLFQKTQPWCLWPEDDKSGVCIALTQTAITPPPVQPPVAGQLDKPATRYLCQLLARFGASLGYNDQSFIATDADTGVRFVGTVGATQRAGGRPYVAVFDDAKNDALYLVVRGTHSTKDWEADFTYQLTEWAYAPNGVARPYVHKGAAGIYGSIRQNLAATLSSIKRKTLFVAGHSLGGAIASYIAYDTAQTGIDGVLKGVEDVRLTTFGSMRPGTPEFAASLQAAVKSVTNVINLADIVPSLPPTWLPDLGSNRCKLYQYALANGVWAFNSPQNDLVSNHMLPIHFQAIDQDKLTLIQSF